MKPNKDLRGKAHTVPEDLQKKATKLEPIKKSGREKRSYIDELDEEEDDLMPPRRESVFDYLDNGGEEET